MKRRTLARPATPLSPALRFRLLLGDYPPRVPGWVLVFQRDRTPGFLETIWTEHRATLEAEAQTAGFTAAGIGRRRPRGPAVDAWRVDFLRQHGY